MGSGDLETTIYTIDPAVWDGDDDGDGKTDRGYITSGFTMSQRKFIRIINSDYPFIYNLQVKSNNDTPVHKANKPEYDAHYEFEHAIDVQSSNFVHIEKFKGSYLWGDGVYIRNCWDVYVKDVTIDWNGRQGGAMISGGRAYFEKYIVTNSRRSGFDIEGNVSGNDSEDFVITFSYFKSHLLGLPMGGVGLVRNVLSINNRYHSSMPIYSRGNGINRFRENIMFVGNNSYNLGYYSHTKNILIDGNEQEGMGNGHYKLGYFLNCKNITIRNNDMPSYGREGKSREPLYLIEATNTPIEEFKIYNNKQKIGIVNKDIVVRADEIEVGKYYFIKTFGFTNFKKLYPELVQFSLLFKPTRKATILDFNYYNEYSTMEEAVSSISRTWMVIPIKLVIQFTC